MACLNYTTLKGIGLDCNPVLAGIKKVYLGYFDEFNVTLNQSAHTATIEAEGEGKFYPFTVTVNTGGLTSTLTRNDQNGVRYYTNTITVQFTKLEAEKHLEVMAMAAESLIGIVETNDGKYWLVGADSYLTGSNSTAQTGSSFDDLNGYTVELTQRSGYLPFEVQYDDFKNLVDDSNVIAGDKQ